MDALPARLTPSGSVLRRYNGAPMDRRVPRWARASTLGLAAVIGIAIVTSLDSREAAITICTPALGGPDWRMDTTGRPDGMRGSHNTRHRSDGVRGAVIPSGDQHRQGSLRRSG